MTLIRNFTLLMALVLFMPYTATAADEGAQILSQQDGKIMYIDCMNYARIKKVNTPSIHSCRLECGKYIKMFSHDYAKFDERAGKSQQCRSLYKEVTGKDMSPTIPKNYVQPKGSAR